jgi:hypothetical protein
MKSALQPNEIMKATEIQILLLFDTEFFVLLYT